MGRATPAYPTLFAKYDLVLIGHGEPIQPPVVSDQLDWEFELGVVVVAPARHVTACTALDQVAGYTVSNDVTVRDWQDRPLHVEKDLRLFRLRRAGLTVNRMEEITVHSRPRAHGSTGSALPGGRLLDPRRGSA